MGREKRGGFAVKCMHRVIVGGDIQKNRIALST